MESGFYLIMKKGSRDISSFEIRVSLLVVFFISLRSLLFSVFIDASTSQSV